MNSSESALKLVAVNWRDLRNPEAGGAEVHIHEILRRMVDRGHEVTFFASRFPGCTDSDFYDGINFIRKGNWYDANFVLPRAVRAFLKSKPADLVLEDINKIPFLLPLYTNVKVLPIVPHLFGPTIFRETNPLFASYVYMWETLIPLVYRKCHFSVISPSTKDDLVRRGIPSDHVTVTLCGLDHGRYKLLDGAEKFERPTIIHFGRVRKYKGIDVIIRAFDIVRKKVSGARLVIVGDGPEMPNLVGLVGKLGLTEDVDFTGRLSHEDMVALINKCHLFMNASPKEGWGLTVIEANACGVPVVGSDRPGLKDSILHEKTGFLVEYGSAEAFAARATQLLSDGDLWNRMSQAGLEWARSMTWDRTADEMERVFIDEVRR